MTRDQRLVLYAVLFLAAVAFQFAVIVTRAGLLAHIVGALWLVLTAAFLMYEMIRPPR
jgi:hypothetical protein